MITKDELWAKLDPFESVESHLKRTGLVCKVGLKETTLKHIWNVLETNYNGINKLNLFNFICYIVAMHDIGKISPFFQSKNPEICKKIDEFNLNQDYSGVFGHENQSEHYMKKILKEKGFSYFMIDNLSFCVKLHHERKFGNNRKSIKLDDSIAPFWYNCILEVEKDLFKLFPFEVISENDIINKDVFFNFLQGLIIICDWIASSEKMSWYDIKYLENHTSKILEIMQKYGLGIKRVDFKNIGYSELLNTKNLKLRPVQKWSEEYFKDNSFDFMIIEAGTGVGKTSIGFYSALHNMGVEDGFYFALPIQSMVNSKYFELSEIFKPYGMHLTLLHSNRDLVEGIEDNYDYIDLESNKNIEVSNFLTSSTRRGLLNKYIVGTIDQLLFSVLPNRYSILRLIGLAGKVIILDEVHMYDAYTSSLISILLTWCKALNIKVILMSATLTKKIKNKYINDYANKTYNLKEDSYPLITLYSKNSLVEVPILDTEVSKNILLKCEDSLNDLEKQSEIIKQSYNEGNNIIVYKNTVKSAQDLYKLCKDKGISDIILCHSRFKLEDRFVFEEKILSLFGKNTNLRPKRYLVISTQVLEASMDVDFDKGFSDISPVDTLIQRAGRVGRFNLKGNNLVEFTVFTSDNKGFGVSSYVYPEIFLRNTEKYIKETQKIVIPQDIRNVIETVYTDIDFSDENIMKLFIENQTENNIKAQKGNVSAILPPNSKKFMKMSKNYILLDEDANRETSTRIFNPSYSILLLNDLESSKFDLENLNIEEYREIMKKVVSVSSKKVFFDEEIGYEPIERGKKRLKNILIMKMKNNEYYFKNAKIKGYKYSKNLGLEFL